MSVVAIVVITVIVALSVVAVFTAEEPLDEVFELEAAMAGFSLQPLSTKLRSWKSSGHVRAPSSATTTLKRA